MLTKDVLLVSEKLKLESGQSHTRICALQIIIIWLAGTVFNPPQTVQTGHKYSESPHSPRQ